MPAARGTGRCNWSCWSIRSRGRSLGERLADEFAGSRNAVIAQAGRFLEDLGVCRTCVLARLLTRVRLLCGVEGGKSAQGGTGGLYLANRLTLSCILRAIACAATRSEHLPAVVAGVSLSLHPVRQAKGRSAMSSKAIYRIYGLRLRSDSAAACCVCFKRWGVDLIVRQCGAIPRPGTRAAAAGHDHRLAAGGAGMAAALPHPSDDVLEFAFQSGGLPARDSVHDAGNGR